MDATTHYHKKHKVNSRQGEKYKRDIDPSTYFIYGYDDIAQVDDL